METSKLVIPGGGFAGINATDCLAPAAVAWAERDRRNAAHIRETDR